MIFLSVILILLVLEKGSCLICDTLGFVYPAYLSFKTLESKEIDDDKIYLSYWLIFSLVNIYRISIGSVISIIPFPDLFRLVFYIYLLHPKTKGALLFLNQIIHPFIQIYEQVDDIQNQDIIKNKLD